MPEPQKPDAILPSMLSLIAVRKDFFLRKKQANYHTKNWNLDGGLPIPFAGLGPPEVDLAMMAIFDQEPRVAVVDPQERLTQEQRTAEAVIVRCMPTGDTDEQKTNCKKLLEYYAAKIAHDYDLSEAIKNPPIKPHTFDFPISHTAGAHGVSFFAEVTPEGIKISFINSAGGDKYISDAARNEYFNLIKAGFESQGLHVDPNLNIVPGKTQNEATTCAMNQMMDAEKYIKMALTNRENGSNELIKFRTRDEIRSLSVCFDYLKGVQQKVRVAYGEEPAPEAAASGAAINNPPAINQSFQTLRGMKEEMGNERDPIYQSFDAMELCRTSRLEGLRPAGLDVDANSAFRSSRPPKPAIDVFDVTKYNAQIQSNALSLNLKVEHVDKTSDYQIKSKDGNSLATISKRISGNSQTMRLLLEPALSDDDMMKVAKLHTRGLIAGFGGDLLAKPIVLKFNDADEEQTKQLCENMLREFVNKNYQGKITIECANPALKAMLIEIQDSEEFKATKDPKNASAPAAELHKPPIDIHPRL